jgi:CDP-diacylglycerol---serine O-phosphatidyltransferase
MIERLEPSPRRRKKFRLRERGRAAMMRGVFFLPSLATLGNAICGFGAMYVSTLTPITAGDDPVAQMFSRMPLLVACYLILFAAFFDVLDGRLARMTRHTTDFGGQLDSLADVISFGCAPAFVALQLFKTLGEQLPISVTRAVWCIGALYVACAAMRLARFNVTNEHSEQHHRSFQGLPSPAAGLAVLAVVLLHEQLKYDGFERLAHASIWLVPVALLSCALLMVSDLTYPHLMNTMLRGRKSMFKLVVGVALVLVLVWKHCYVIAFAALFFAMAGPLYWLRRPDLREEILADDPVAPTKPGD